MASDNRRSERVAEGIREIVATFLMEDAKDPRIVGLVTVTGVDVTRDLRQARIFVSVMGNDDAREATFQGLTSLASHLRARVGKALRLRFSPELTFQLDNSIAEAARIESLLAQVRAAQPAPEAPADGATRNAPDGDDSSD